MKSITIVALLSGYLALTTATINGRDVDVSSTFTSDGRLDQVVLSAPGIMATKDNWMNYMPPAAVPKFGSPGVVLTSDEVCTAISRTRAVRIANTSSSSAIGNPAVVIDITSTPLRAVGDRAFPTLVPAVSAPPPA